jgi:hypothetical protein
MLEVGFAQIELVRANDSHAHRGSCFFRGNFDACDGASSLPLQCTRDE